MMLLATRRLVPLLQSAARCSVRTLRSSTDEQKILAAAENWQRTVGTRLEPELRFPVGAPVECRIGESEWAGGTVAKHKHREPKWPEGACVPYQVLLDPAYHSEKQNAVWAPADIDECIRAGLRFRLGDSVECCIGDDVWARGTVVAHFYREPTWPENQFAPYQVRLDEADGTVEDQSALGVMSSGSLIWAPHDTSECIRPA